MTDLRIQYDRTAGAVWIPVSDQQIQSTMYFGNGVCIDKDANNVPVGVEILNVTALTIEDVTE